MTEMTLLRIVPKKKKANTGGAEIKVINRTVYQLNLLTAS
jgi:hypothetical protein